jgi:hypothetical protein
VRVCQSPSRHFSPCSQIMLEYPTFYPQLWHAIWHGMIMLFLSQWRSMQAGDRGRQPRDFDSSTRLPRYSTDLHSRDVLDLGSRFFQRRH